MSSSGSFQSQSVLNKRSGLFFFPILLFTLLQTANVSADLPENTPGGEPEAGYSAPPCYANGVKLPLMHEKVLDWKRTTQNQFVGRARLKGVISRIFEDRNHHDHFEMRFAPDTDAILEVVYNQGFGALPELKEGMTVEACGDYITSIAQSGPYPPSPSGAIIHWLHRNPKGRGHDHGYLIVEGKLFGQSFAPKPFLHFWVADWSL